MDNTNLQLTFKTFLNLPCACIAAVDNSSFLSLDVMDIRILWTWKGKRGQQSPGTRLTCRYAKKQPLFVNEDQI